MSTSLYATNILLIGDSLSTGYGLPPKMSWVELLTIKLAAEYPNYQLINASTAGNTTREGSDQLPSLLQKNKPALVIIELGGNDGLRGLPIASSKYYLNKMMLLAQAENCEILLIGVRLPPNYGAKYLQLFEDMYVTLAQQYQAYFIPRMLTGVAESDMLQADGIHPTQEAQPIIMQTVWRTLVPILSAETKSK